MEWDRGVWGRVGWHGTGVCGAVWGEGRVAWDKGCVGGDTPVLCHPTLPPHSPTHPCPINTHSHI